MNAMTEVLLIIAAPALIALFVKVVLFISDSADRKACEMAKRPVDYNPYKFGCPAKTEKKPEEEKKAPTKAVIYENRKAEESQKLPAPVLAEVPETEPLLEEARPVKEASPELAELKEWLDEPHVVQFIKDSVKNGETTIPKMLLPADTNLVKKIQWYKFELGFSSVRILQDGDVKIKLM